MTHPIIKTDNYILITSDEEIKIGDYHVATRIVETNGDKAIAFTDENQLKAISEIGGAKKIIAHLSLNNSPILDGVDLLPPLPMTFPTIECIGDNLWEELTGGQEVSVNRADWSFGFGIGYNKAKEKYKFTEDDIRKAIAIGYDWCHQKYIPDHRMIDNFIQSLSQPKLPVGFKCEMELNPVNHAAGLKLTGNLIMDIAITQNYTPKITNGVMQGEWIFE